LLLCIHINLLKKHLIIIRYRQTAQWPSQPSNSVFVDIRDLCVMSDRVIGVISPTVAMKVVYSTSQVANSNADIVSYLFNLASVAVHALSFKSSFTQVLRTMLTVRQHSKLCYSYHQQICSSVMRWYDGRLESCNLH